MKPFMLLKLSRLLLRYKKLTKGDLKGTLHVSHESTYKTAFEPFYVALELANPPHDEEFVGYGYTRNTQVQNMFRQGWSFHVMSPAFVIHLGFAEPGQNSKVRESQVVKNRHIFSTKYGKWLECPGLRPCKRKNS